MERRTFLSAAALFALKPSFPSKAMHDAELERLLKKDDDDSFWREIRHLFPLESSKVYLNNGTMGITPYPVMMAVESAFREIAEKGHYPVHTDNLEKALAELIGAESSEIAITKNVSEGTNHACWGIPMKAKEEVIMTRHEHVGGSLPWILRSKSEGIVIKVVDLGQTAEETLGNIERAITKKTRVIAVPHIPCTIGQILPVKEICSMARAKGIITAIDGAHPLGMIRFNVKEIDCDYYYGCIHKWALGPIGTGFMYINKNILDQTLCTRVAAYSTSDFNMATNPPSMAELSPGAGRFTYGTFSSPLFVGATKALELYKAIGPERIENRSRGLATYLQNKILEFGNKIEMVTPQEAISRGCQISFRIKTGKEKANNDFISEVHKKGIIVRYVSESGLDCIRVSTHYYNSENEVDFFIDELKKYIG